MSGEGITHLEESAVHQLPMDEQCSRLASVTVIDFMPLLPFLEYNVQYLAQIIIMKGRRKVNKNIVSRLSENCAPNLLHS